MTEDDLRRFLDQKLCEIGRVLMAHYDPCQLQGDACKAGDPNPCCTNSQYGRGLCPFWMYAVPTGTARCQFDNCDCILWLCNTALDGADPTLIAGLKHLEQFGKLYGLVRAPLIGHPYSGADRQP